MHLRVWSASIVLTHLILGMIKRCYPMAFYTSDISLMGTFSPITSMIFSNLQKELLNHRFLYLVLSMTDCYALSAGSRTRDLTSS